VQYSDAVFSNPENRPVGLITTSEVVDDQVSPLKFKYEICGAAAISPPSPPPPPPPMPLS
jgi:hypothetical protein